MEQKKLKACPKCKEKLYRNGTRNGKQRWRCSNNECKYTFTENVQISAPKNNAVGFLYNVMKQLSEYSAKLDDDIIQTKIRETKYKSKGNYDTKIAIEYIRNFDGNYTIDANSFIHNVLNKVSTLPVDLTVLSVVEEKEFEFLQKQNLNYLQIK